MPKRKEIVLFLLLGGLAAGVNWIVRFPLSLVMPFPVAVVTAYFIGMATAFPTYRGYVFPNSTLPIGVQLRLFLCVNAVGAIIVMAVSLSLLDTVLLSSGFSVHVEAVAHGIGIAAGAVANFLGHKYLTFRVSRVSSANASDAGSRLSANE